jgi:tripartite-type tricarboxylate transporter receptor subunit TctC
MNCGDGSLTSSVASALAQPFPERPLRIVASQAGGGNDVEARATARGLMGLLERQVIVGNRPRLAEGWHRGQ